MMKSIKPGRGPSMMGGIGSIAVGIGGVIWTIATASMGAPPFFILFGIMFVVIAVIQAVYHMKNATGENRMSVFDITENEPDPMDYYVKSKARTSGQSRNQTLNVRSDINFCPNCGEDVADEAVNFCPSCGQAVR